MKKLLMNIVFASLTSTGSWQAAAIDASHNSVEALRPLLNSERIKLKFGSYTIGVIKSNPSIRVSNLYSSDSSGDTTRTLAVVTFAQSLDSSILSEHKKIVGGQSLGAVFKQAGWHIDKEHVYFGELKPSKKYARLYSRMKLAEPHPLSVHIYNFVVNKGESRIHYATIAEVHHPEYLSLADLNALYLQAFAKNTFLKNDIDIRLEAAKKEIERL